MEYFLDILNEFIKEKKLKNVVLVGHSMGGAICMSYFLKYNKIKGLILIGTGAKLKVSPVIFDMLNKDFDKILEYFDSISLFTKDKEIKQFIKNELSKTDKQIYIKDFYICNKFDIMNQLDKITVPTLIMCGDKDILTPVKYSKYMNEKIKNSILHIIEKSGHLVQVERYKTVNKYIKNFIDSNIK